jgi:diguanylate cyclase (GGDEF)-like protein
LRLKEANEAGAALSKASLTLGAAKRQATLDVLTGLPNRALFNDLVNRQIAIAKRVGSRFSVLYIDLDGFKPVSDIHGHAAGDAILCEVAGRLRSGLRGSDMAARLGRDEFAVILVGAPGSSAGRIANILIRALSKPYDCNGEVLRISASIGVAGYPEAGTDVGEPGVELLETYKPHWSKGKLTRAGLGRLTGCFSHPAWFSDIQAAYLATPCPTA